MRTHALVTLVFVGVGIRTAAADPAPPPIEKAIQDAAAAKKPLVLEFYATWCGPCKTFETTTLRDPRVQKALALVTLVRYDAEEEPGKDAAKRFGIKAYPTLVVVDSQGIEQFQQRGALLGEHGVRYFVRLLEDAPELVLDDAGVRAAIKSKPDDAATQLGAARWFARRDIRPLALARFDAVAALKSATPSQRAEASREASRMRRLDRWKHDLIAEKLAALKADPSSATYDDLALLALGADLPAKEVRTLLSTVLAATANPEALNDFVYIALAAGATDEALDAAKRVIDAARDAQHLDTMAEVQHVRGDRSQALAFEDEALSLSRGTPMEETLTSNRARFASGSGDAEEIVTLRQRVDSLWKRLPGIDRLPALPPPLAANAHRAQVNARVARYDAERELGIRIGKECAAEATKGSIGHVVIHTDAQGRVEWHRVLLDEQATPKLRACMVKVVTSATLPPMPEMPDRDGTLVVSFK